MKKNSNSMHRSMMSTILRMLVLLLVVSLLPAQALAEAPAPEESSWVSFFLICNEGMLNDGGNSGNTMMVISMNPENGMIRLMPITWDTFIEYEGYDIPQKLDMPYRNNGPEEALKVFNANFGTDIGLYMSLNYLNLATLIDAYGGVNVDISRAERNALNGMVASKKASIQAQADSGLLSQMVIELLADEYYLNDYGPETHLNGLQAVGFGWLQYDSVYNCCLRDAQVVSDLFESAGTTISQHVLFYTNETERPEEDEGRRIVNLDELTDDDMDFLRKQINPIIQMSVNNLTDEDITDISLALARTAYAASRQGVDIFASLKYMIFPLEAKQEYDMVAGTPGHLVDYAANGEAMREFLFAEE